MRNVQFKNKSSEQKSIHKRSYTKAFTLAETLITLLIVGVVAALIIPNFTNSINDETLSKQKEVFSKKFQEGLSQMRVDDKLAENYSTTQDFVNQMQKYFKITQVCDKENLDNCFDKTFYARAYYKGELTASKDFVSANLRTTKDLNENASFDTDIIGLRLSDGTQMLITYNPDCTGVESGDTQGSTTTCFSYVTDVNGNKGPNLYGKDVVSNVALIHNFGLSFEMGEVFTPTIQKTCEEIKSLGISINDCSAYNDSDPWANAMYKCAKEGKRLPTMAELLEIATNIYGVSIEYISTSGQTTQLTVENTSLYQALRTGTPPTHNVFFWSSEEYSAVHAYSRPFSESATGAAYNGLRPRHITDKAFCVE